MPKEIMRIGVYWYPPEDLTNILERTWAGDLNQYKACELVARHCGNCPSWGVHATLLDAVAIIAEDRPQFVDAMSEVLKKYLPIELPGPEIQNWGVNTFISHWDSPVGMGKFSKLRFELMKRAQEFVVVEQVSWEQINELERLVGYMGDDAGPDFVKGLNKLKEMVIREPLKLIYAPNIPLEWYVQKLASPDRWIESGVLPIPPIPHVSITTAVRHDDVYDMAPEAVGRYIAAELPRVPGWDRVLGEGVVQIFDSAVVVEPVLPFKKPPITVTQIDRITGAPVVENLSQWVAVEKLPL